MRVRVIVAVAGIAVSGVAAMAGSVSAARPDMCVSVNGGDAYGEPQVQYGSAYCVSWDSDGAANIARAMGDEAFAAAGEVEGDSGNRATASGDGSVAVASVGDGNTAMALGDGSFARAQEGNGNTATASGDGSWAEAADGDGNTAIASGDGSSDGISDGAYALGGDSNTAIASGDYSYAFAGDGDRNTAIALGDGCRAEANSDNDITVICP